MLSFVCVAIFVFIFIYLLRIKYLRSYDLISDWIGDNNYTIEDKSDSSRKIDVLCWPIKARVVAVDSSGETFKILFSIKVNVGTHAKGTIISVEINPLKKKLLHK